ncbi:MAG: alcohol dehydrogenase catalytic domain-containing protein [Lapillicoccus sp.]
MRIRAAVLEEIGRPRPFADSRPIAVTGLDLDEPGPGELLVRVEAAGVCHSDLSVVDGNRVRPVPMVLGHEAAGIVEATGPDLRDLSPGQRVVMTFLPRCGHCAACRSDGRMPCSDGSRANNAGTLLSGATRLHRDGSPVNHHLGVSGFATYAVVDRRSVVPVDADVPPDVAAVLGCAVLTGGGAVVNSGRPEPGQTVMVVGLGGVGMAALITAVGLGGLTVVGVDAVGDKLATARRLGAATALTPQELADSGVKADVVIEAAGNARAVEAAVAATAVGGRTVTVGLPAPDARASFSPLGLVAEGRTIVGSYLGSAVPQRDIPRFVEMWRAGRLPVEELVSSTIGLDDINHAMDQLADGRAIRQLIRFDRDGAG